MPAEDIINWLQRTKYTGHRTPDTPAIGSTSGIPIPLKSNHNYPFSILNSPLEQICFQVKILCRKRQYF
ncbi:unknown [Prevotella sp. CAG:255]|nr:unknown [Prevotella sp. CAG:255]